MAASPAWTGAEGSRAQGAVRGTQQHPNTHRGRRHLSRYQVSTTSGKKSLFLKEFYLERPGGADECLREGVGSRGEARAAPREGEGKWRQPHLLSCSINSGRPLGPGAS